MLSVAARSPKISRIPDPSELTRVKLQLGSPLESRTIQDLNIRSQVGASVVSVTWQGVLHSNPGAP